MKLQTKRVYDAPSPADGARVLVDRVWPRGLTRAEARIDAWQREVAPSSALRRWFGHDPARWEDFKQRYFRELDEHPDAVARLIDLARQGTLTLLYAARDEQHNNAVALKEYLERHG